MSEVKITTMAQVAINPEEEGKAFKLQRGQQANLMRIDPTLKRMMIGIGWDVIGFDNEAPDLDVSVFLLDKHDKTKADEDFVFYNNLKDAAGSVEHLGDNRTGAGEGDDENIMVDLMALPYEVSRVQFVISIYDAAMKKQNFSAVRNCFLRIMNDETGIELMRFNLDKEFEETPDATGVVVGFLERSGPNWFFEGVGRMLPGGLKEVAVEYGIVVAH